MLVANNVVTTTLVSSQNGDDGQPSDIAKALAKKEAEEAEKNRIPTEDEVMVMCGYDPAKADDYSTKEMDEFAKKAIKMNKSLGRTQNAGVGSLEGPDGRNYGRYEPNFVESFFNKRKQNKELNARLAEERARKYDPDYDKKKNQGEKEKQARQDAEPTGLNTVFSRQGKRS